MSHRKQFPGQCLVDLSIDLITLAAFGTTLTLLNTLQIGVHNVKLLSLTVKFLASHHQMKG